MKKRRVDAVSFPFWKMHGAGNDFILVHDTADAFPVTDTAWLQQLAARRTGIGAEGIILLQPSPTAAFRMRFFNPDGHEAELCGNGARCAARLAVDLGIAGPEMTIDTGAGPVTARVTDDSACISLPPPADIRPHLDLDVDGTLMPCAFVNTGVPHVVLEVTAVAEAPVDSLGPAIRRHPFFAPAGANVNFAQVTGPECLALRTFERGVEGETGACGTGAAAAAILMGLNGRVTPPVTVGVREGSHLVIDFDIEGNTVGNVTLTGPAAYVFEGEIMYRCA